MHTRLDPRTLLLCYIPLGFSLKSAVDELIAEMRSQIHNSYIPNAQLVRDVEIMLSPICLAQYWFISDIAKLPLPFKGVEIPDAKSETPS